MSLTFTKLFSNITESTVWCEPDRTRLAWICMLAMADQHGRVFASIPGLASRARIPVEDARQAIDTFLSPDRDSRTKVLGGRRITEIDGGWVLVNHEKYRTLRDDEAILASKRKYINERRARERAIRDSVEAVEAVTSTVEKSRPIAEAEAEAEIKTVPVVEAVGAEKPKARGSRLPADWALPDAWREWAKTNRPDLNPDRTADSFRDYWAAKSGASATKVDWEATWRNWVRGERPDPTARRTAAPSAPEPDWRREQRERMATAAPYAVARTAPRPINPQPEEDPQHALPLPRTAP